jgi:hypothetical protein
LDTSDVQAPSALSSRQDVVSLHPVTVADTHDDGHISEVLPATRAEDRLVAQTVQMARKPFDREALPVARQSIIANRPAVTHHIRRDVGAVPYLRMAPFVVIRIGRHGKSALRGGAVNERIALRCNIHRSLSSETRSRTPRRFTEPRFVA